MKSFITIFAVSVTLVLRIWSHYKPILCGISSFIHFLQRVAFPLQKNILYFLFCTHIGPLPTSTDIYYSTFLHEAPYISSPLQPPQAYAPAH